MYITYIKREKGLRECYLQLETKVEFNQLDNFPSVSVEYSEAICELFYIELYFVTSFIVKNSTHIT